jgi:hypothetical protein
MQRTYPIFVRIVERKKCPHIRVVMRRAVIWLVDGLRGSDRATGDRHCKQDSAWHLDAFGRTPCFLK